MQEESKDMDRGQPCPEEERSGYGEDFYLNYGEKSLDPLWSFQKVLDYIDGSLRKKNLLTEVRRRSVFERADDMGQYTLFCDFCGRPLTGVSMEKMSDGRIRCESCASSQIENSEEFMKLVEYVRLKFESSFETDLPYGIHALLEADPNGTYKDRLLFPASSKPLQKRIGAVLKRDGAYVMVTESGISRLAAIFSLVGEYTQVWISDHWNQEQLEMICRDLSPDHPVRLEYAMIRGMSLWAAVEYMYRTGETSFAKEAEEQMLKDHSPDGLAFRLFTEAYPLNFKKAKKPRHPFHQNVPIDLRKLNLLIEQVQ